MKQDIFNMRKLVLVLIVMSGIISCKDSSTGGKFSVSGKIENNNARMIYLEELPAASQPIIADSARVDKDGNFLLSTGKRESMLYCLRLDDARFPAVYLINDAEKVDLDIHLSKEEKGYVEKYELQGSPASQSMKDFIFNINSDLEKIYYNSVYINSQQKEGAADSVLFPLYASQDAVAEKIHTYAENAISKANNPALIIFELGYYQSNTPDYGVPALGYEKINEILEKAVNDFPSHKGIADVKKIFEEQNMVGRQAPDFSMPDVNGNEVALSSFRGKYVLVDFWASWCAPCREENPNIVRTYEQYKDKNFTVLGVSLDRPGQKDKWLKAIKDDGLSWTHVSDLQDWQSSVVSLYRFNSIPYNVLVDPGGKIVAESLRGPALEATLKKLLPAN